MRIGACLRLLATGEPYSSLETSFQISKTVLVDFCHKFLQWFLKYYYTMYYYTMGLELALRDGLPHEKH